MIYKINILLIIVTTLTFSYCTENHNFVKKSFSNEDILLKVTLKNQNSDNKFLYAELTVRNVSDDAIKFTNAGILAISLDDTTRAYKDDISSWVGDYSSINIPAKDSLRLDIYFAFDRIIPDSEINKINIIYRHPG